MIDPCNKVHTLTLEDISQLMACVLDQRFIEGLFGHYRLEKACRTGCVTCGASRMGARLYCAECLVRRYEACG